MNELWYLAIETRWQLDKHPLMRESELAGATPTRLAGGGSDGVADGIGAGRSHRS